MVEIEAGLWMRSVWISNPDFPDWTMCIRKKDDTEVGEIGKFDKKTLEARYLREMLNGWERIEWTELDAPEFLARELAGHCGDYKINLVIKERSKLTKQEIIDSFQRLMSG